MKNYKAVKIIEVGPRDGFQSISQYIPLEIKISLIDRLISAGLKHLEITSFISPKTIPQMKDSLEIVQAIKSKYTDEIHLTVFTPDFSGASLANEQGVDSINFAISVSESHNKAKTCKCHKEAFKELEKIANFFAGEKKPPGIRLSMETAFGCPFEGSQSAEKVAQFITKGTSLGISDFTFVDTIGVATPIQMEHFWESILPHIPEDLTLTLHLHDARGLGLANVLVSLQYPIKGVETAFGGIGNCPFTPGAAGNIATEDMANMLDTLGFPVLIDLPQLIEAAYELERIAPSVQNSHMKRVIKPKNSPCSICGNI